jgi:transketolase
VLKDVPKPEVVIVATGSEVSLALDAAELLQKENGVAARVVSMPCVELFKQQPKEYRDAVLPAQARVAVVEAGVRCSAVMCWLSA